MRAQRVSTCPPGLSPPFRGEKLFFVFQMVLNWEEMQNTFVSSPDPFVRCFFDWARGAIPERKPQERGEMRRKRLILSPPLRFSLRLSFLIPPLSCSAFQQSAGEK